MSLRDYDKLTPKERRDRFNREPCAICEHAYECHRADGKPESRYVTACNAPCDCEGYVHRDYHDLRLRGVQYSLTKKSQGTAAHQISSRAKPVSSKIDQPDVGAIYRKWGII